MRRRRILAGLLLSLVAPLTAKAQQAGKVPHRCAGPDAWALNLANLDAFRRRRAQYAEGQNFVIEYRSPEGRPTVSLTWHMSWFA